MFAPPYVEPRDEPELLPWHLASTLLASIAVMIITSTSIPIRRKRPHRNGEVIADGWKSVDDQGLTRSQADPVAKCSRRLAAATIDQQLPTKDHQFSLLRASSPLTEAPQPFTGNELSALHRQRTLFHHPPATRSPPLSTRNELSSILRRQRALLHRHRHDTSISLE